MFDQDYILRNDNIDDIEFTETGDEIKNDRFIPIMSGNPVYNLDPEGFSLGQNKIEPHSNLSLNGYPLRDKFE